ncbi:MAG: hypothetical protein AAGF11_17485 [Myxococcota bacterium]
MPGSAISLRIGWGLALSSGLWACSSPSPSTADGKVASPSVAPGAEPEPSACSPATARGVWARLPGDPCAWELRDHSSDDGLALYDLARPDIAAARGDAPSPCRAHTCVYHGALTSAGPVVLAIVPSARSGMPSDVQLGVVHDAELAFVSLWDGAGEPVVTDLTSVGPAHALAPFVCGEALALLAVERLPAGHGQTLPHRLRAREGRVDAAALDRPAGAVDRDGCTAIDLPIP